MLIQDIVTTIAPTYTVSLDKATYTLLDTSRAGFALLHYRMHYQYFHIKCEVGACVFSPQIRLAQRGERHVGFSGIQGFEHSGGGPSPMSPPLSKSPIISRTEPGLLGLAPETQWVTAAAVGPGAVCRARGRGAPEPQ